VYGVWGGECIVYGVWGGECIVYGVWGGESATPSRRHDGGRATVAVPCPGAGAAIGKRAPVTGSTAANPSRGSPGVLPGC
jgi:hypothetical protein